MILPSDIKKLEKGLEEIIKYLYEDEQAFLVIDSISLSFKDNNVNNRDLSNYTYSITGYYKSEKTGLRKFSLECLENYYSMDFIKGYFLRDITLKDSVTKIITDKMEFPH